jgi:hypothetical protein
MARKARARGEKAGSVVPTERDLQDLRRLLKKAGSLEELGRWNKEYPKPKSKRGRPRKDLLTDFSVEVYDPRFPGPAKGLYVVRFRLPRRYFRPPALSRWRLSPRHYRLGRGRAAALSCIIVTPKKHWVKDYSSWGSLEITTPHEAIREIVKGLWEVHEQISRDSTLSPAQREKWNPKYLGPSIDSITRRLTQQLREAIRAQKGV